MRLSNILGSPRFVLVFVASVYASACGGNNAASGVDAAAAIDAGAAVDASPADASAFDASIADAGVADASPFDAGNATPLAPGTLQFIGVNSDLPEGFALVPLVDIPSGTALRFTERAWNTTSSAFETPEGSATLTLSADLTAGTVFEVSVTAPSTLAVTPDIGTIVNDDTGNWGIAGNGDNLFVYTGADASPTFIAGIAFSSPVVWTTNENLIDGQHSMIPATLSEGANTITTFTPDNLRYTGPRTGQGSIAAYLALIADENNYETGNTSYTPLRSTDFAP